MPVFKHIKFFLSLTLLFPIIHIFSEGHPPSGEGTFFATSSSSSGSTSSSGHSSSGSVRR